MPISAGENDEAKCECTLYPLPGSGYILSCIVVHYRVKYILCNDALGGRPGVKQARAKQEGSLLSSIHYSWSRSGFIPGGRICVCDHETWKSVFGGTTSNCELGKIHPCIKRNLKSLRPLFFAKFSSSNEWFFMIFIFGILVFKKVRQ